MGKLENNAKCNLSFEGHWSMLKNKTSFGTNMGLVLPLKLNFKQVPKLGKSDHFCTMHVCELTNEVLKNAHFFRQTKSFKTFTACLSI